MSPKRSLVVTMASFVALMASLVSAQTAAAKKADAADNKAPRLTIVEPVKEYGEVPKGDKLDWSFVIKNTGNADMQIIAAKPGCGCTVANFDKVVKPGVTGKATAHVDTTAFTGPITNTVTLETNDPAAP